MLVFDVTNSKSFENVGKWLRNIQEHATDDVERMLVGNKVDMEDKRVVPRDVAQKLAAEHSIPYFETSAKNNQGVEEAFLALTQAIYNKRKRDEAAPAPGARTGHAADNTRVDITHQNADHSSGRKCCWGAPDATPPAASWCLTPSLAHTHLADDATRLHSLALAYSTPTVSLCVLSASLSPLCAARRTEACALLSMRITTISWDVSTLFSVPVHFLTYKYSILIFLYSRSDPLDPECLKLHRLLVPNRLTQPAEFSIPKWSFCFSVTLITRNYTA